MSKILLVVQKTDFAKEAKEKLNSICKKLEPDNIIANSPLLSIRNKTALAIANPMKILLRKNESIVLGHLAEKNDDWDKPLSKAPNGAYALIRNDEKISEILTDSVASRTLWYYFDETIFISSTSQRAILMYLGNFEFEEKTIPWMLSTGSLGPTFAWDKRIKRILPATSLILDKDEWKLTTTTNPKPFLIQKTSFSNSKRNLFDALKKTFESLQINLKDWTLPISGGYDSRGILFFLLDALKDPSKLQTITWGLKSSQKVEGNDAFVAKKIVRSLSVPHKYYNTDIAKEPVEDIIERFILLGEGRIDHIAGYMDGLKIWKTLFENDVQGIIRGDEGFGWVEVSSSLGVRLSTGSALCSDYSNLNNLGEQLTNSQVFPPNLKKQPNETLSIWRDRIYHEYRIPTIIAALSDLKLAYVEQIAPLLTNGVLQEVRKLPDKLRTDKRLFREIIHDFRPRIEYAKSGANLSPQRVLENPDIVTLLRKKLISNTAKTLFPELFINEILNGLKTDENKISKKSKYGGILYFLKKITPTFLKNIIRSKVPLTINYNILAFRVYMIIYMHDLLYSECKQFN